MQASPRALWAMPLLQCAWLAFFLADAVWHLWYNWWLLAPCFVTGTDSCRRGTAAPCVCWLRLHACPLMSTAFNDCIQRRGVQASWAVRCTSTPSPSSAETSRRSTGAVRSGRCWAVGGEMDAWAYAWRASFPTLRRLSLPQARTSLVLQGVFTGGGELGRQPGHCGSGHRWHAHTGLPVPSQRAARRGLSVLGQLMNECWPSLDILLSTEIELVQGDEARGA